ncbi:MAG: tRNA pseudouridine65 synthase [Lentimonas sp.]|jgi:tRNA pseudouridine65 synthase
MTSLPHTTQVNDLPLGPGVRLITSNEHGIVALDKPAGLMSHPNAEGDTKRALLRAHYDYDGEVFTWKVGEVEHRAWLINRLDSPTSGVILLALNEEINTTIKQMFSTHKVSKIYYALVKHAPTIPAGSWSDQLKKNVYRGKKLIQGGQLIPAKTRYQVIKTPTGGFPVALLRLMPLTGRTHQLRVQCQNHRHPVVGDRTYGSFSFNKEVAAETGEKRMMLHSSETSMRYVFRGKIHDFKAVSELPESFAAVMRFRPGLNSGKAPVAQAPARRSAVADRRFRR